MLNTTTKGETQTREIGLQLLKLSIPFTRFLIVCFFCFFWGEKII